MMCLHDVCWMLVSRTFVDYAAEEPRALELCVKEASWINPCLCCASSLMTRRSELSRVKVDRRLGQHSITTGGRPFLGPH